ncbi:radical SAM family heme chaperone HemW [Buchananella hordeovulneris]|uniref:radical SAM family heme chaperone HemW n=1 Tax=Buchananella hordeovulneris TaxID=52770 RepID=UPI000F5F4727|nr:radical SAM family heme chaperone HemW [Buchananella hordeovulneris]RRD45053.1 coproporphyrinogen III oxidase [Buchananella hordeovulneris]
MSPALPPGQQWPATGVLPPEVAQSEAQRALSLYVHVPFCAVRCGYCDFNTYTVGFGPGAEPQTYATSVLREADLAARALADSGLPPRPATTVFFGGGTPTALPVAALSEMLAGLTTRLGVAPHAEITLEANPDSVDAAALDALAAAGFTRVSFGMQSAQPHVLATLERTHDPTRVGQVVAAARAAGLSVSVDLIYGTPGESLADWRASLQAAIATGADHISAYSLVIEEGTKMAAQVRRGELALPSDDDAAEKYELADELLGQAGYRWYEISNFARALPGERGLATHLTHASRHNLAYWRDHDWWGFGPGAHSHVGRARWWNVKHPRAYADRVAAGRSPAAGGEVLDAATRELERVMLGIRTAEGLASGDFPADVVARLVARGLVDAAAALRGRLVLTLAGRLLADDVTRVLTD